MGERPNGDPLHPGCYIRGKGPVVDAAGCLEGAATSDQACLDCHNADVAEDMGAVAVPASHRMDLRNSPGVVGDTVTGARLVCISCHVAQTGAEPLVAIARP